MESVDLGEDVAEGPARVGVEHLGAPQLHARECPDCHSAVGGLERLLLLHAAGDGQDGNAVGAGRPRLPATG